MTPDCARYVVLALLALLALSVVAWQWTNLEAGSWWPLAMLLPLLAPLPGIIRGRRYTYAWASLIAIAYIAIGVTEVIAAPAARMLPALILFTAFALFVAMVAFIRLTRASPG